MKKHYIAAGALIVLGVVLIAIGAAEAHTPLVQADCRTMSVDLVAYEPHSTVQLEVDGAAQAYRFDGDWHKAYPWDPTVSHSWVVRVDNRGDGVHDQWDQTFTGTTTPCAPPATSSTTVPVVNPPVIIIPPAVEVREATTAPAVEAPRIAFTG